MDIQTRLLTIRILDQMKEPGMKGFSEKIKITDESYYTKEKECEE